MNNYKDRLTERLNPNNFAIYATWNWKETENITNKELNKDLKIFSYIGRNLNKYIESKDINIRIILNQIIRLNNSFGDYPSARLLFFYYDAKFHSFIKTCLLYLKRLPKEIPECNLSQISLDDNLIKLLEEL